MNGGTTKLLMQKHSRTIFLRVDIAETFAKAKEVPIPESKEDKENLIKNTETSSAFNYFVSSCFCVELEQALEVKLSDGKRAEDVVRNSQMHLSDQKVNFE